MLQTNTMIMVYHHVKAAQVAVSSVLVLLLAQNVQKHIIFLLELATLIALQITMNPLADLKFVNHVMQDVNNAQVNL